MKKALFLIAFSLLAGSVAVNGQTAKEQQNVRKEQRKEYKKEQKLSLKELSAKASKTARKEAKRLKKEGWKTEGWALPGLTSPCSWKKILRNPHSLCVTENKAVALRLLCPWGPVGENLDSGCW